MTVGWDDPFNKNATKIKKFQRFSINTWSLRPCDDCATRTIHKDAKCTVSSLGRPLVSCEERLVIAFECGADNLKHTLKHVLYQEEIGWWAGWKLPPSNYTGFDIYSDKSVNFPECAVGNEVSTDPTTNTYTSDGVEKSESTEGTSGSAEPSGSTDSTTENPQLSTSTDSKTSLETDDLEKEDTDGEYVMETETRPLIRPTLIVTAQQLTSV